MVTMRWAVESSVSLVCASHRVTDRKPCVSWMPLRRTSSVMAAIRQ